MSTENLLAEFLQEVRDIAIAQKRREDKMRIQREKEEKLAAERRSSQADLTDNQQLPDITMVMPDRAAFIRGDEDDEELDGTDAGDESHDRDTGGKLPGY